MAIDFHISTEFKKGFFLCFFVSGQNLIIDNCVNNLNRDEELLRHNVSHRTSTGVQRPPP